MGMLVSDDMHYHGSILLTIYSPIRVIEHFLPDRVCEMHDLISQVVMGQRIAWMMSSRSDTFAINLVSILSDDFSAANAPAN